MSVSLFCSILLVCCCFLEAPSVFGFQSTCRSRAVPSVKNHRYRSSESRREVYHFAATTSTEGDVLYDDDLIAKAAEKLDWEKSEQKSQRPILNLSLRDASPEEATIDADEDDDSEDWNQGQRWAVTVDNLSNLGLFSNDEGSIKSSQVLLQNCPQLFRLDPSSIQETAQWIIDEFGLAYLQAATLRDGNSILLSFRKDDTAYGLEFMSVMMMMDAKMACAASSAFFLEAIRGGVQERAVSAALGAASSATSQAGKSIASETMESFRQLRDANRHKK